MSTQSSPQQENYLPGSGSPYPIPAAGKYEDDGNNSDGESSIHSGIGLEAMDLTHTDALSATSAQENMNLSSESELVSDDLLKIEGKGCIGKIEKLPLGCKILLSCLFSICALFFFGAVTIGITSSDISLAYQGQTFAALTGDLANKIKAIQNERGAASLVLVNVGQAGYVNYYLTVVNRTNIAMANITELQTLDPLGRYNLKQIIANVTTALQQLTLYRSRIAYSNPTAITAYSSYQFYSEFVQTLLSALYKLSSVFGYRLNPSNFVQLLELEEQYDLIRTIGSMIAGDSTLSTIRQQRFNYVRATRDYLEKIFLSSASQSVNEAFLNIKTKKETPLVRQMEAEMSVATHANMSFTEVQWYINTTAVLNAFSPIKDMVRGGLNDYAAKEFSISVAICSVIVPAFIIATIISMASSFFFSRTIVGPWRRMNILQSMTISKFVPKGFLNLMRWKAITDAQLGACASRDMCIMILKIKNYTETMSKLPDTSKTFQFMTDYLDYIAPLVKEHQGYIDKHFMDRFVLYFTREQKALRCANTILKATQTFNVIHGTAIAVAEKKTSSPTATANTVVQKSRAALGYPPIHVAITLSYGKCLIGTVGEVQRMESSLVSSQFTIAQKLQSVAKKVGASLLISKSLAEKVGKHKLKQVPFRLLGNLKLGKHMGDVEVIEIVDDQDAFKMKSRSTFNKAVVLMHQGKYAEALQKFESIAKASISPSMESSPVGGQIPSTPQPAVIEMKTMSFGTTDKIVKAFMTLCSNQMVENQKRISQLLISQVLTDSFLHSCFEEFCKTEHSEENIHLWDDIQQFKALREPADKKTFARYIYEEYVDIKGGQTVNINEEFKRLMREQMESIERRGSVTAYETAANSSSPTTTNLMRVIEGLELEIEVLMNDTLKRFRMWPKLKQEFHRSKHAANLKHIKPEWLVAV